MPVIEHVLAVYKVWHEYRDHLPQRSRYTLGDTIDARFVLVLELLFAASYQAREQKIVTIERALIGIDMLKFLLRVAWEVRALDNKKYALLSEHLHEAGRMVGGWKKGLAAKTPAQ